MALGFRTGGMFGRKPSYERQPWDTPGIGDGFNQRMSEMGDVNPSAMPIGVEQMTQKQSFFQRPSVKTAAGILGDTLLTLGGGKPMYAPMMHERRMQEEDARLRQQLAQQQRMQAREDLRWKWANKPKDAPNNDTVNDFQWYKNLSEEDRRLYHQMKPAITYDSLGRPVVVNPYEAQKQSGPKAGAIEDGHEFLGGDPSNPANWRKVSGGQPVAPAVGFR